jgi:hypothetical protein
VAVVVGWFVGGVLVMLLAVGVVIFAGAIASANDTKGPEWLRNFSLHGPDPARPDRTKPGQLRAAMVLVFIAGFTMLIIGLDPHR